MMGVLLLWVGVYFSFAHTDIQAYVPYGEGKLASVWSLRHAELHVHKACHLGLGRHLLHHTHRVRAAPLLRGIGKITVKNTVCHGLGYSYTAFLTVDLTLTLRVGLLLQQLHS